MMTCAPVVGLLLSASAARSQEAPIFIPAGVPLRVNVDHGYRLKVGTRIAGRLNAPVYVGNRLVLPKDAAVSGAISRTTPMHGSKRTDALLNGDFTPLCSPEVAFDTLTLPNGDKLAMQTVGSERTTEMVRFGGTKQPHSIVGQVKDLVAQKKQQLSETVTAPEKMDRLRRFLYGQLPYHPQEIWAGTQFDAELTRALAVPKADAGDAWPLAPSTEDKLAGTLLARLDTDLDSATTKQGAPVRAVLTKPLMDAQDKAVLLPEGTALNGTVLRAKPARSFGRNGALRFTFRQVVPPKAPPSTAHGQLVGAEGSPNQNLSVDEEGGVQAHPDKGRFLAPLVLALLAVKSGDNDGSGVAQGAVVSNGFGVVARIVGMAATDRNVASGFAYYGLARSVYKRFLSRGHNVKFARNTELAIQLSER